MSFQVIRYETPAQSFLLQLRNHATSALAAQAIVRSDFHAPGAFQHFVYLVPDHKKATLALSMLMDKPVTGVIVYVKTNFAADHLAEELNRAGVTAESIHNNKGKRTRLKSLENFCHKSTSVLVATESAASAMNVSGVTTIINYDLPVSAESYIKRINDHSSNAVISAKAFSFCNKSEEGHLSNINRVMADEIEVLEHCLA